MRAGYKVASEHTGIPEGTLRAKVSRKQIPHYRVGKRSVLFDLEELSEWLATMHVADPAMAKRRAELLAIANPPKTDEG